jgi:hypothetical protein
MSDYFETSNNILLLQTYIDHEECRPGILHRVALVRTDDSEELRASIIRDQRHFSQRASIASYS